jgi:hypothetical protein
MIIQLPPQYQEALDSSPGEPLQFVDPRTNRAYVLVPRESLALLGRSGEGECDGGSPETPEAFRRSRSAFLRDLPQLLEKKKLYRRWVAYHGEQRLFFGASQAGLYRKCQRAGLAAGECYVGLIRPHPPEPEQTDPSCFEFTDTPAGAEDLSQP